MIYREQILRRNWQKARRYFPMWTNRKRYEWAQKRTDLDMMLAGVGDGHQLSLVPISFDRVRV